MSRAQPRARLEHREDDTRSLSRSGNSVVSSWNLGLLREHGVVPEEASLEDVELDDVAETFVERDEDGEVVAIGQKIPLDDG